MVVDPVLGETSKFPTVYMLRTIGNLFMKCMQQVTKGHSTHLFGVLDYYAMNRQRAQFIFEMSANVTNWVTGCHSIKVYDH